MKTLQLWALVFMPLFAACGSTSFTSTSPRSKGADAKGNPGAPNSAATTPLATSQAIDRTFFYGERRSASIAVAVSPGSVVQDVTLTSDYTAGTTALTQAARPMVVNLFQQGNPGAAMSQTFQQTSQGVLDVQLVVDNSGSMTEEQGNLSTRLAPLLEFVKDSDWRINVVTTDTADGCSRALISKGDSNAAAAFASAVQPGIGGSGNERGILTAVNGLACATPAWVRPQSTVAVLIVSDEDNCSNGADAACAGQPYATPSYLLSHLSGAMARKLGTDARVYGVIWPTGTVCAGAGAEGKQYLSAIQATSGTYGSICDSSYTATLEKISKDISLLLKSQFQLTAVPDAGSLQVTVNGAVTTSGYQVSGQTLTFTTLPPKGATIGVSYVVGASPVKTRFALSGAAVPGTATVLVNGQPVAPGAYSIDATTNELVFASAPAADASIKVDYRSLAPALPTEFAFATPVRAGSLRVQVNGQVVTNYTVAAGKITFAAAPPDAARIELAYDAVSKKILEYPVALAAAVGTPEITDKATGTAAADAAWSNGVLVIADADHTDGRVLQVRFKTAASGMQTIKLPRVPVSGSTTLRTAADKAFGCLLTQEAQSDETAEVRVYCKDSAVTDLSVQYDVVEAPAPVFQVVGNDAVPADGVWTVYVNGTATADYTREGGTVTLKVAPPAESVVRVTWLQAK